MKSLVKKDKSKLLQITDKILGKIKSKELALNVNRYKKVKILHEKYENEKETLLSKIKPVCLDLFLEEYKSRDENPKSILMETELKDQFVFAFSGKYGKLSDDEVELIKKKYGKDVIISQPIYFIDPEIMEKYGDTIKNILASCEDLPEDIRGNIIQSIEKIGISKTLIDKVYDYTNPLELLQQTKAQFNVLPKP